MVSDYLGMDAVAQPPARSGRRRLSAVSGKAVTSASGWFRRHDVSLPVGRRPNHSERSY